jgi:asparagine synthase (glutamine-hydrolysing)
MSGITGIYNLDGCPVDPRLLTQMTDAMTHRGLDGSGQWLDGAIGFGHRMLHSTPESLYERQPALDELAQTVIVADARIDNRDELISILRLNEKPRGQITDPELILKAYQAWEEASPERLSGDFAFAIWDKSYRRLFCARDAIGIKPFYYYFDGAKFLWASEPRTLFQHPAVPKQPNRNLMGRYLLDDFSENEETLYKGIYRLPPAHSLSLRGKEIKKKQYWDIDPSRVIRYKRDEEYTQHFFELFRESVKSSLR